MGEITTIDEYRPPGGRNFIRTHDWVKVGPSRPNKHDGFCGTVIRITANPDGSVRDLTVGMLRNYSNKGRHDRAGTIRTVYPDRVERMDQTRQQRLLEQEAEREART